MIFAGSTLFKRYHASHTRIVSVHKSRPSLFRPSHLNLRNYSRDESELSYFKRPVNHAKKNSEKPQIRNERKTQEPKSINNEEHKFSMEKAVGKDELGLRLDRWLRNHFPKLPQSKIEQLLRKKKVCFTFLLFWIISISNL